MGGRGRAGWRADRETQLLIPACRGRQYWIRAVLIFGCVDVEFHSTGRRRKRRCGGLAAGLTCKTEKEGRRERAGLIGCQG